MLKNISKLETMVAGKVHQYLCDNDSQLDHVIEALVQFLSYTQKIKDTAQAQKDVDLSKQEGSIEREPKIEETKVEENVDQCQSTGRICC